MKNQTLNIANTLTLIIGLSISLSAQFTATWQGGKPGRTTDWDCAANWREGRTPDEFSQVIIPSGVFYYPILKNEATPIDALLLESGSSLTIREGAVLTVLAETGRFDGILIFPGEITNNGTLIIENLPAAQIASLQQIQGAGSVVNALTAVDSLATGL